MSLRQEHIEAIREQLAAEPRCYGCSGIGLAGHYENERLYPDNYHPYDPVQKVPESDAGFLLACVDRLQAQVEELTQENTKQSRLAFGAQCAAARIDAAFSMDMPHSSDDPITRDDWLLILEYARGEQ